MAVVGMTEGEEEEMTVSSYSVVELWQRLPLHLVKDIFGYFSLQDVGQKPRVSRVWKLMLSKLAVFNHGILFLDNRDVRYAKWHLSLLTEGTIGHLVLHGATWYVQHLREQLIEYCTMTSLSKLTFYKAKLSAKEFLRAVGLPLLYPTDYEETLFSKTNIGRIDCVNCTFENTLWFLRRHHGSKHKPQTYLSRLMDKLLGAKGLAFVRERRISRRDEAKERAGSKKHVKMPQTSTTVLFTKEFLSALQVHMEEVRLPISAATFYIALGRHWYDLSRTRRANPFPSADVTDRTERIASDDKHSVSVGNGPTLRPKPGIFQLFVGDAPPSLPCEEAGAWKVPLIDTEGKAYTGLQLYLRQGEMQDLKKYISSKSRYTRRLFVALMGEQGADFIREKRKEAKEATAPGERLHEGYSVKKLFTQTFMDTISLHLEQNGIKNTYSDVNKTVNACIHDLTRPPRKDTNNPDDD